MAEKLATIFSVPKAFSGHIDVIQRNALASWKQLGADVDILMFGDDDGVAEVCQEMQVQHVDRVERNSNGTPLLDSVFRQAAEQANTPLMIFVNSDIVFNSTLVEALKSLIELEEDSFLAIGKRMDFDQQELIEFESERWDADLNERVSRLGRMASILCKDYFVFRRGDFDNLPPFAIGRGNWDNWMVAEAVRSGWPVVDLTSQIFAGHQNHGHQHAKGRRQAYVTGEEAQRNKQLAGGTNYVTGSVPTHRLISRGRLKRINRMPLLAIARDLPTITRLVLSFFK